MDSELPRLRTDDFDFELPPGLIAQEPLAQRDAGRMLVLDRDLGTAAHRSVRDLPGLLEPSDLLVLNNTRVLPARVWARRRTGGRVELLFLRPAGSGPDPLGADRSSSVDGSWWAFVRPAKKLRPGERIACERDAGLELEAIERHADGAQWRVRFVDPGGAPAQGGVHDCLVTVGEVPLPPYVDRAPTEADGQRYQTVFASRPGAVAAPTAGLHFTEGLLGALAARGVERTFVTLHVGAGTFLPVSAEHLDEHAMHTESFELGQETADAVARCRASGGRVIAIGTTSARVLESCAREDRTVEARAGRTDIFIHPGAPPRIVDALFTNFHLPKSTLLMLVASLAGVEPTLAAYREAVREEYRFYSYGDAMFLA